MERCERRCTMGDGWRRGSSLKRNHGLVRSFVFPSFGNGAYRVRVITVRVKLGAVVRFDGRRFRRRLYRRSEFVLVYTHVATAIAPMSNVVRTGRG